MIIKQTHLKIMLELFSVTGLSFISELNLNKFSYKRKDLIFSVDVKWSNLLPALIRETIIDRFLFVKRHLND